MTTDQAYKQYQQARSDLLKTLNEGNALMMREYYRSKSRPLDEAVKNRIMNVAAEIQLVMRPVGKQRVYTSAQRKAKAKEWVEKLYRAFDHEIPKENQAGNLA